MTTRITFAIEVDVTEGDQHDAEWFADCAASAIREWGYHVFFRFDPDSRDRVALNQIAYLLKDPDWGVAMLEDIAEIVGRTDRPLGGICELTGEDGENPDDCSTHDHQRTWARH